jgi:hypothetical protein
MKEAVGWLVLILIVVGGFMWWYVGTYQPGVERECAAKGGTVLWQNRGYLCLTPDGRVIP